MKKDISIVIPLLNEEESIVELNDWIKKVMTEHKFSYEVLYIDDGSTDSSWKIIEDLNQKDSSVKGIKFRRNYGKSGALNVGFAATEGNVVFTMDADLQDSPEELPEMYKMITEQGYHIVSGWKKKRFDPLTKTIPTKLFNWATRKMTGIQLNDFNCGLKAYQSQVVKNIEVYGEMHRYIPAIAKWAGFTRITEKPVAHQERKYGVTKFGLERFINGFLDLLSIFFVGKFGKRPMHFFGLMGTLMFFVGFAMATIVGATKVYYSYVLAAGAPLVTSSPYFYIGLTSMILGVQLFLVGFLAELVSRNSPNRNNYKIEEELL